MKILKNGSKADTADSFKPESTTEVGTWKKYDRTLPTILKKTVGRTWKINDALSPFTLMEEWKK